jgi:hypothetical protein
LAQFLIDRGETSVCEVSAGDRTGSAGPRDHVQDDVSCLQHYLHKPHASQMWE